MRYLYLTILVFYSVVGSSQLNTKSNIQRLQDLEEDLTSLESTTAEVIDSLDSLKKALQSEIDEIQTRLEGYESFKSASIAYDDVVKDYGSNLFTIVLVLTALFGIFYILAANMAAKSAFESNYDTYLKRLNNMVEECGLARDRLLFQYKSLQDTQEDVDDFASSLENDYQQNP